MKREFIKYEKLSTEIKKEISEHYKKVKKDDKSLSREDAMEKWFDTKFEQWLMDRLAGNDSGTRRKHYRLEVEIPIKIIDTLIESASDDASAIDFIGRVINISRGGLYFKYTSPIEVSSIIKVIIDLSKIDKELSDIEALAMVIRVDKEKENEYGIGIMFSSIYGESKDNLDLFILKNLSYHIYSE